MGLRPHFCLSGPHVQALSSIDLICALLPYLRGHNRRFLSLGELLQCPFAISPCTRPSPCWAFTHFLNTRVTETSEIIKVFKKLQDCTRNKPRATVLSATHPVGNRGHSSSAVPTKPLEGQAEVLHCMCPQINPFPKGDSSEPHQEKFILQSSSLEEGSSTRVTGLSSGPEGPY